MNNDTEVDLKDVELNEVDQEKQPMTAAETGNGDANSLAITEKNGSVKVKIPEEAESKFTGLSKEQLLKVAGTPGWVRTRWALLVLFWLGWLGMLAGAIGIIIKAPRCKPLPELNWWNYGALYQIGDVNAFTQSPGLKGLAEKMDYLSQLKVKGLVVGPIHSAPLGQADALDFEEIPISMGTLEQFKELIKAAQKKSMKVVLDLTPNYLGGEPWFSNTSVTSVAEKLKPALTFWLKQGVDGVKLSGVEKVSTMVPLVWADIRAMVQNTTEGGGRKVLIGVTERSSPAEVAELQNQTGVDLLLSRALLSSLHSASLTAQAVQQLYSGPEPDQNQQHLLAWSLGGPKEDQLGSLVGSSAVQLQQLLLLTLPGTPIFNYGDEIGLMAQDSKFPKMPWGPTETEDMNETSKAEVELAGQSRKFFKAVSELRVKERSLQFGEYIPLFNSSSALAYLRVWDQSARFVAAFNWNSTSAVSLRLVGEGLPKQATVRLSSDPQRLEPDSAVTLAELELAPGQAVLLGFPYVA